MGHAIYFGKSSINDHETEYYISDVVFKKGNTHIKHSYNIYMEEERACHISLDYHTH